MSADQLVKGGIGALRQFFIGVLAWIVGYPLTWVLKRDSGLIVVISRRGPVFADNSKYFFVHATQSLSKGERVVFLTGHRSIQAKIAAAGGDSVRHPSWQSLYLLLRCNSLVTDMAEWFDFGTYQLTRGARIVQIWHGAPLKHIELDVFREHLASLPVLLRPLLRFQKAVLGRYPEYDVVVATSQHFIEQAFKRCFKARHFIASGYPRNDILFSGLESDGPAYQLARINVDEQALKAARIARSRGQNIILYAPTFRKDMADPFEQHIDLQRLSAFACQHDLLLVLKLHPVMQGRHHIDQYPNLLEYASLSDVYPFMPMCDLLVTDYSSIFFDFLLLDKPIIFFAYDLEHYLRQDRAMYLSYENIIPGALCRNQNELELHLESIKANGGEDVYSDRRAEIRVFTHNYVDNKAADRLLNWLKISKT